MATKKYVSLDKLTKYDTLIKNHIDTKDAATLASAKSYAESLGSNYDTAGAAAGVQGKLDTEVARAKAEEERIAGLVSTAQGEVDALEGVVAGKAAQTDLEALESYVGEFTHDTAKTVVEYINAKTDGIATSGNLEALGSRVTTVEGKVSTIEGDYLKKADKTELEGKITTAQGAAEAAQGAVDALSGTHATDKKALEDAIALKADQTALDAVSGVANAAATKVELGEAVEALEAEDARIAGLITAEAERAAGVEGGLDERLTEVEAFFKLAEGEQLDTAMDTLVEIQKYITDDGAAADEMVKDIAANAKAIEDHMATDHDFAGADAALKSELEGKINAKADSSVVTELSGKVTTAEGKITTVEGKVSTLEGEMDGVQAAVATKAEQSALTEAIEALEGADEDLAGRIETLEGKFGGAEGSVEDQIADAKQEAIDAAASAADTKDAEILKQAKAYADEEDAKIEERVGVLETASATHALKSEVEGVAGRVTTVEGKVGTLESEMDAVEALAAANKAAHEANASAIALKASQVDLEAAVARIAKNETDIASFVEVSEEEINKLFGIVAE